MIKKETMRDLFGAAFRDGCFFTLRSMTETLVEYAVENARTSYGRMAGMMADQLNREEVKKAYEEKAEEYGTRILDKIKEAGEDDCYASEIPAAWQHLPPIPGFYVTAYYGRGSWCSREAQGVGLYRLSADQIKDLKPKKGLFYFGPIPVAELLGDANVHV